jgi:hypothetical protein
MLENITKRNVLPIVLNHEILNSFIFSNQQTKR